MHAPFFYEFPQPIQTSLICLFQVIEWHFIWHSKVFAMAFGLIEAEKPLL